MYQSLRYLGRAMALRTQLARRAPPAAADALLCTALALSWHDDLAPYAPHTLVNQAVEAAKRHRATQPQASFLNACLRRFLREREALVAQTEADPVARWNHPRWWIEQLQHDHPDQWQAILQANQQAAPMTLRVFTRRVTRAGQDILLQPREFRLLEYLMRNAGHVVTRTMLLEHVWDYHFDPQTNVIDVHISRLRAKIDRDFATPLLHTVRGAGYSLRAAA